MVAGLKFLSKKSFNPQNLTNQKSVWEREQEHKREVSRIRERERQLTIERDHEELAKSRDGAAGGQKATLRFMYDAPPGLQETQSSNHGHDNDGDDNDDHDYDHNLNFHPRASVNGNQTPNDCEERNHSQDLFQRKSGDDDAAIAFRLMLAGAVSDETNGIHSSKLYKDESIQNQDQNFVTSSLIISGSTAEAGAIDKSQLTQLEKAVGKKNGTSTLTYQEQIARFPQLKNAPVALKQKGGKSSGAAANSDECVQTHLNFKPLGAQIRNVRCMACKIWGHSKGDRECQLSGWDPFSLNSSSSAGTTNRLDGSGLSDSNKNVPPLSNSLVNKEGTVANQKDDIDNDDDEDYSIEKRKHKKKRRKREKESKRTRSDDEYKHEKRKKKSRSRDKRTSYEYSDDDDDKSISDSDSRRERQERRRRRRKRHQSVRHRRSDSPRRSSRSRSRSYS